MPLDAEENLVNFYDDDEQFYTVFKRRNIRNFKSHKLFLIKFWEIRISFFNSVSDFTETLECIIVLLCSFS